MNLRVKRLALFISFSAACLGSPYSAIAADSAAANQASPTDRAHPQRDRTPPVLTLYGDSVINLTQYGSFNDPGASAVDAVDGRVAVYKQGRVNTARVGSYTLTYTATDRAGNTATATRTVNIVADTIPPTISLRGEAEIILVQGSRFRDLGVSATDNTGVVEVWSEGRVNTRKLGVYVITYTARDRAGNTSSVTRTIKVVAATPLDTQAPVIQLTGSAAIELTVGDNYTDAGATATDNVDTAVVVTTSGAVDTTKAGVYTLQYNAQDAAGNKATTVTRTVTVKAANLAPTANAGASQTINELTAVTLDGSASADTDGTIVSYAWVQTSGPSVTLAHANEKQASFTAPDVTKDEVLSFKLTVTDNQGAIATSNTSITVKMVDSTKPIISLTGPAAVELTVGDTYTDAGATATDDVDTAVVVTTSGEVDTTKAGVYTLQYNAQDAAGNKATRVTRTVTVKAANLAPTANAGADQTVDELINNDPTTVILTGSATDTDGSVASYAWTQIGEPTVTLSQSDQAQISFTAPNVAENTDLIFKLTVTDDKGATAEDTVTVTIRAVMPSQPIFGLNDTGVNVCAGSSLNDLLCPVTGYPNQDAEQGRDATDSDPSDGYAGFSFTKLDSEGQPLADQTVDYATNPWSCVKDNVTGLVWEVKTNDNGLRDKDWSFSWYEPNLANGGYVGIASGPGSCDLAGNCNTSAYTTRVNTSNLCGFNDWRLPSSQELMGIALIGSTPSIDQNFFPNTDTASPYWTNETFAIANTDAWEVIFSSATSYGGVPKYAPLHVRLVRGQ